MMRWLRATAALALLLFRHWARASLPSRLRRDTGRRVSAALFRLAYLVLMSGSGYGVGLVVAGLEWPEHRLRGTAWLTVGVVGLSVVMSALSRGPTLRGEPSPLEARFLDSLPLREESRLVVGLVERVFVQAVGAAALIGAAPAARGRALVVALAISTAGVFAGEAMMRAARALIPPMTVARTRSYLLVFGQVLFLMCMVQAPSLARSARISRVVDGWPSYVAEAVTAGRGLGLVVGCAAGAIAVALLAIGASERAGYDKVDLVPGGRPRRSKTDALVLERVDDVLRRREPGGRWSTLVMMVYTALVTAGILGFAWKSPAAALEQAPTMLRGACGLAAFGAFVVVSARATRTATRDVAARPLLAPLPIEPRELLAGKVSRLRRDAILVAAPTAAILGAPWPLALRLEVAWRVGSLLVAVVLAATAASSIAFLTVGAGSKKGPGGSFAVESVLVLAPLIGVVTAPYAWSVVVPLAALGLVAREAGKSGLGCVRWLDDPDDFERETPVWRALLVLGAFQSAQVLAGRLVALGDLDEGATLAIAYAASSLVLLVLTAHARREAPAMRLLPDRPAWMVAGALAGGASGALALGYLWVLRTSGVELPSSSATSWIAIALIAVAFAPFAEETFFRGWLLPCIEEELGPRRRRWLAPLLGAFAFAAVHPPLSFAPVFVLGLVSSLLFARTRALGPSIVAHAIHNGLAVALAV